MSLSLSQISSILQTYSFNFKSLPSRLKCIFCLSVLKNSKQTSCGCKICEKCINNYLSEGPKPCPSNQPECQGVVLNLENIYQDNATNKEIGNLNVNCPFKLCTFSNTLKNMVEHIDECEFREVDCEQCKEKIKIKNKKQHNEELCEMRNVICVYCNQQITSKDHNNVHLRCEGDSLCSKFEGICPNNCEVKEKTNLKEHLNVCQNKKQECPFHSLYCQINKLQKEHLKTHLEKEIISHSSSLVDAIQQLQMKVDNIESELLILKQINKELSHIHQKSSDSLLNVTKSIEEYQKKIVPVIPMTNNKEIFRNGNLIWKFTDFEIRKLDAERGERVSVTSDPFYTSEFGYKMCLKVYPAGDGVGKSSHLSVFFVIMKGEYDNLLSWPFKQKVTLSIFDLESGTKNHSETFKPDTRSICYQKPTDECNIASGSPRFISLSQLSNNSIYCKNDTIYIKISADLIGICRS